MKKLFISMLAVAALASCSKEQTIVADQGELIGFSTFVENSTRATDPSYSNKDINTINVYGTVNNVLIYDHTPVTRPSTVAGQGYNVDWKCDVKQYWIDGAPYKFIALVDVPKANISFDQYKMPESFTYTADGKTDVLCDDYATTGQKTDNETVTFTFKHLLSKVNFTVLNGTPDAEGYSFVVKNIKFDGATKATYNVATSAWNTPATATGDTFLGNEHTVTIDDVDTPVKGFVVASGDDSEELANEVLFIPGEYSISFTVDILYNGKPVTTTDYPVTSATYTYTLAANNAYNFKVNVAVGEAIKFSVEKKPTWEDGDTPDDTTLTL